MNTNTHGSFNLICTKCGKTRDRLPYYVVSWYNTVILMYLWAVLCQECFIKSPNNVDGYQTLSVLVLR